MSLSSSLYTGTSGLINMGNVMQVVSNNLANSNTVGFKKGTSAFADVLNESIGTQAGVDQLGRGVAVGEVAQSFNQGSFESTSNTTDLAISGNGFFIVEDPNSNVDYYTRAGNFHFDEKGYLINPNGYNVQGENLLTTSTNGLNDVYTNMLTSPPSATSRVTAITNLNSNADPKETDTGVLSNSWIANNLAGNISGSAFEFQAITQVYDSLGESHDVTIHYDKKANPDNPSSSYEWDYIITCNPDEDKRATVQGTESQGLLARGTISFDPSTGEVNDITMSELTGRIGSLSLTSETNTEDDIHFTIEEPNNMALDGSGFGLAFTGGAWALTAPATPAANPYLNAVILNTDTQNIEIDLDNDGEVDLKLNMENPPSESDTISFDINAEELLHAQGIDEAALNITQGTIKDAEIHPYVNNPEVLTEDMDDLQIIYDPNASPDWTISGYTGSTTPKIVGDGDKVRINFDDQNLPDSNLGEKDDIVFTFDNTLSVSTTIEFDINGSTAWKEIEKENIKTSIANGYFSFTTDFIGDDNGASEVDIEFDIGSKFDGTNFVNDNGRYTTHWNGSSTPTYMDADGSTSGDLQSIDISADGVMTGVFSNGELVPLFQIGLAKFLNNNGLYNSGGNLFSETVSSGTALTGIAGAAGLGTISSQTLEMSNVDISEEFVQMITTQRGFQANSKTVTTVDDMLSTVIQMKR